MDVRKQFTFYQSYAEAVARIRKKADRADAYDAIVNYALYGTEPDLEKLSDSAAIAFGLIRPVLDTGRRRRREEQKITRRRTKEARQKAATRGSKSKSKSER